mmetsp:Transcript_5070/g.11890  ORF Transcript_5070/g.11890 Transcript_5070/m.11890 type:complete len:528 (-) Transcript_5070:14-1597(-)
MSLILLIALLIITTLAAHLGGLPSEVYRTNETRSIQDCVMDNTVVVTAISVNYEEHVSNALESVLYTGFPCHVVIMQDGFSSHLSDKVLQVGLLSSYLLPDSRFCTTYRTHWGWRRTQLYKTWAFHLVIQRGFDVLLLDVDRQIPPGILPFIRKSHHDIVAISDNGAYLNFGMQWTRSGELTKRIAQRAWNRTWHGWDQYVWNEEIESTKYFLRCCKWGEFTERLKTGLKRPSLIKRVHNQKRNETLGGGITIPSRTEIEEKLLRAREENLKDDIQVLLEQYRVASEYEYAMKHNPPNELPLIKQFFSSTGYEVTNYDSVPSKICVKYSTSVLPSPFAKTVTTEFSTAGWLHDRRKNTCASSRRFCEHEGGLCTKGIRNKNGVHTACCPMTCSVCGGVGCKKGCCVREIKQIGRICVNESDVSCVIKSSSSLLSTEVQRPPPGPMFARRINSEDSVCCPGACSKCGGVGCKNGCCIREIKQIGRKCSRESDVSCVIKSSSRSVSTDGKKSGLCAEGVLFSGRRKDQV